MISIDEMQELIGDLLDELPAVFFEELNGGVNLLPDTRKDPAARAGDLYIMGEYCIDDFLGRTIFIYYGSFEQLFGDSSIKKLRRELRDTVRHEFRHHIESLAGENGLDLEDHRQMETYFQEQAAHEQGISEVK